MNRLERLLIAYEAQISQAKRAEQEIYQELSGYIEKNFGELKHRLAVEVDRHEIRYYAGNSEKPYFEVIGYMNPAEAFIYVIYDIKNTIRTLLDWEQERRETDDS